MEEKKKLGNMQIMKRTKKDNKKRTNEKWEK